MERAGFSNAGAGVLHAGKVPPAKALFSARAASVGIRCALRDVRT